MPLFGRRGEPGHPCCPAVAEPWNTASNVLFSILALVRLGEVEPGFPDVAFLYWCLFAAGICSAIHHATKPTWTIVIDYLPIVTGVVFGLQAGVLATMTRGSFVVVLTAFIVLLTDEFAWLQPVPVPWGHVAWHLFAAIAFDGVIWDYYTATKFGLTT